MKRKNGFTLIELLAVIVILAIIALIATPIILGVIEKARIGAAQSSAYGYIDAVEKQIAINILDSDETNNIVDDTYTVKQLTDKGVTVKGHQPTGTVTIKNGQVTDYKLVIDEKYTITPDSTSDSGSSDVAKVCKIADGSTTIDVGTEVDCAGEHFYVYNTDGDNIKMLSKYNLKVGGVYSESYTAYTEDEMTYLQDENMKGYVKGQSKSYGTTVFSSDNQKGTNYSDYSGSVVEGYVNKYKEKLIAKNVKVEEARLITIEELQILGCDNSNNTCTSAPSFVYSTSYWSGSPGDTYRVWYVYSVGDFYYSYYDLANYFGVRPVIVISKSSI